VKLKILQKKNLGDDRLQIDMQKQLAFFVYTRLALEFSNVGNDRFDLISWIVYQIVISKFVVDRNLEKV
jgi:hypothetical protein